MYIAQILCKCVLWAWHPTYIPDSLAMLCHSKVVLNHLATWAKWVAGNGLIWTDLSSAHQDQAPGPGSTHPLPHATGSGPGGTCTTPSCWDWSQGFGTTPLMTAHRDWVQGTWYCPFTVPHSEIGPWSPVLPLYASIGPEAWHCPCLALQTGIRCPVEYAGLPMCLEIWQQGSGATAPPPIKFPDP